MRNTVAFVCSDFRLQISLHGQRVRLSFRPWSSWPPFEWFVVVGNRSDFCNVLNAGVEAAIKAGLPESALNYRGLILASFDELQRQERPQVKTGLFGFIKTVFGKLGNFNGGGK